MRPVALAATLAGGLLFGTGATADIWKRVDEHGMVHLTDRPQGHGWVLILRSKPRPGRAPAAGAGRAGARARFEALIRDTAERYALDAHLVHAVVRAESAYDPAARSSKGAVGLMQLMPATAERYGVVDRTDPAQNLAGGVRYLRDLLVQFRNVTLALAAYNAGENAVVRYGNKVPPFPETRAYVERVVRYYRELATRR